MRPVSDDDMVTRSAPDVPVRSDLPDGDVAAEREADKAERVEERQEPGVPGIEEAGYGYGV